MAGKHLDIGLPEHLRAPRPQIPTPDGRKEEGHRSGLLDVERSNKTQEQYLHSILLLRGSLVLSQGVICKLSPCQDCKTGYIW